MLCSSPARASPSGSAGSVALSRRAGAPTVFRQFLVGRAAPVRRRHRSAARLTKDQPCPRRGHAAHRGAIEQSQSLRNRPTTRRPGPKAGTSSARSPFSFVAQGEVSGATPALAFCIGAERVVTVGAGDCLAREGSAQPSMTRTAAFTNIRHSRRRPPRERDSRTLSQEAARSLPRRRPGEKPVPLPVDRAERRAKGSHADHQEPLTALVGWRASQRRSTAGALGIPSHRRRDRLTSRTVNATVAGCPDAALRAGGAHIRSMASATGELRSRANS